MIRTILRNGGQIEVVQLLGSALNATGAGDAECLVGNDFLNRYFGNDTLVGGLGSDTGRFRRRRDGDEPTTRWISPI